MILKKILKVIAYILALYVMESILYFMLSTAERALLYQAFDLRPPLRDTLDINGARIIFYGFMQVVFFILMLTSFYPKRTVHVALINCALYVFISCAMSVIFESATEYFTRGFFFRLVVATFVSPFILSLFRFRVTGMFTRINIPGEDYI